MTRLRDYVRLRMDYYEDDVLMAAADECAAAMHLWPVLIGMAKRASHADDNPGGVIRTTVAKLARDAYVPIDEVRGALDALAEGELVTCSIEGTNRLRITLTSFQKWQNARGSSADRKDTQRANVCRENMPISHAPVPQVSRDSHVEREEEREGVSVVPNGTTSSAGKPVRPHTPKDPLFVADKASVEGCFEFYCDMWEKRGIYALELTAPRRSRIATAIRKHGKRVVADVIRYHHANDWRHESLDRNDITVLLREKNIQAAIEGMRGSPTTRKRSIGNALDAGWNGR